MSTTALVTNQFARLHAMVVQTLNSPASKRTYETALKQFITWHAVNDAPPFVRATAAAYKDYLLTLNLAPATINLRLSAVRKLAAEARDNGLIPEAIAGGIIRLGGVPMAGARIGNWLTKAQVEELLRAPDRSTTRGVRDRAILTVYVGCGLRESEVCKLTAAHLQQREGRWVICDLTGKGGRVRSVPMPAWTYAALDRWLALRDTQLGSEPVTAPVFRQVRKGGMVLPGALSNRAQHFIVRHYGRKIQQPKLAPHDLRRTFGKLTRKGGAQLEQIQLSLGHADIRTTMVYIGNEQDMVTAPCDALDIDAGSA